MTRTGLALAITVALAVVAGCMPRPPRIPPPRPAAIIPPPAPPPMGSLWHPERADNYPVLDVRARFPGDLLTILVSEQSQGKKDASTEAKAQSSISASVEDFFGIPAAAVHFLPKGFNPSSIVKAETARDSKGDGTTSRDGTLTASITVTVVGIDTAGNLRVQGDKIITVNREEQYIVLSGMVRPEDIASDNTLQSARLADARIDYYGRGTVSDKQNVPLVHRAFDWIWPF
jgi:flagellar L-ring protein precursor FlgH